MTLAVRLLTPSLLSLSSVGRSHIPSHISSPVAWCCPAQVSFHSAASEGYWFCPVAPSGSSHTWPPSSTSFLECFRLFEVGARLSRFAPVSNPDCHHPWWLSRLLQEPQHWQAIFWFLILFVGYSFSSHGVQDPARTIPDIHLVALRS